MAAFGLTAETQLSQPAAVQRRLRWHVFRSIHAGVRGPVMSSLLWFFSATPPHFATPVIDEGLRGGSFCGAENPAATCQTTPPLQEADFSRLMLLVL